jgi:hypothetical protein
MRSVDRQVIPPDVLEQRLFGASLPDKNRVLRHISAGAIEARNNLEKARLAFEAQQKEKAMPDIKTALQQALAKTAAEWAADDEAHQQIEPQQEKAMTETTEKTDGRIKSNVSRSTFYFVRDNPGLTPAQVTVALMEQGHKAVSVGSLINQMINTRMIMADDQGRLSAVIKEYIPIQSKRTKAQVKTHTRTPRPELQQRKQVTLINTRTGEVLNPKPAAYSDIQSTGGMDPRNKFDTAQEWTVDSVIGSLNVRQAMAVYDELRKIFGD